MTINEATNLDQASVLAQIDRCLSICALYVNKGELTQGDFRKAKNLGLSWLSTFRESFYHTPTEAQDLEDQFYELNYQFQLKAHGLNDEVKQVSKPVPSNQLPVLSVLGQVTKARPVFQISKTAGGKTRITTRVTRLSPVWCPSVAVAAHLLFNPRSIGGLGQ